MTVDVIDKDLHFPVECGDANALKLEKYLTLLTTTGVTQFSSFRIHFGISWDAETSSA